MVNMNLLNSFFDVDMSEISNINRKSVILLIIIITLIIGILLCLKKNYYYVGEYNIVNNEMILLVEKDYLNKLKKTKNIIINDIENSYSINTITPVDENYLVNIKLNNTIKNIQTGKYKIFIGKENLFDFILRIIKK